MTLDRTSRLTRQSIRALQTLLVDINPPTLHSEGLTSAVSDLLSAAAAGGLEVVLDADADLRLPPRQKRSCSAPPRNRFGTSSPTPTRAC